MDLDLTPQYIFIVIVVLVFSLVVHEFMHGFVGYLLGDTTAKDEGRLNLNPLNHVDPYMTVLLPIVTLLIFHAPILAAKPVPFNPNKVKFGEYGAALLAAAGPLSNLVLAIIGALLVNILHVSNLTSTSFLGVFILMNVYIFVFNLVPIPPLDGSRVLYAFAPSTLQQLMSDIEPYGLFIVFAIVLLGGNFLGNIDQFVINHIAQIFS
jgi:Zn-dependent protease